MPVHVIRRLDNPNRLLAWGYTLAPGGLGPYDPTVYEEAALAELPTNWQPEPAFPHALVLLTQLRALFQDMPIAQQYAFRQPMAEVATAAQGNNRLLMLHIIEQLNLPPELEPLRTAMVAVLSVPPDAAA